MRVIHVASGDSWGGAERVVLLLVEAALGRPDLSVEALLFNEGRLADALRGFGIPVHVIPEADHSFLELARATRRWLTLRACDVVHAHRYKEILLSALAVAPRRRGLIVTVHGLEPRAQLTSRRMFRIWGPLFAARLAGARFVTVSEELRQRLGRKLGQKSVAKIFNPIPPVRDGHFPDLRRQLGWHENRPLVGFVGRLEFIKGPDRFLGLAADCCGDAGFVLIGGGSLERDLAARATSEQLSDRVGFVGEVSEAAGYLRQFDVLALPSRHEGLPLVVLEAAAYAIPVVAFDVGGVHEVLDGSPGARLIPPGDGARFRSAVEEMLEDRERARAAAVQWASTVRARFSPSTVLSAYLAEYSTAAGTRR